MSLRALVDPVVLDQGGGPGGGLGVIHFPDLIHWPKTSATILKPKQCGGPHGIIPAACEIVHGGNPPVFVENTILP